MDRDDRLKVLKQQYSRACTELKAAQKAFDAAEQRYASALESSNRTAITAATAARKEAADRLKACQVREAEVNYAMGGEPMNAHATLRGQVGRY